MPAPRRDFLVVPLPSSLYPLPSDFVGGTPVAFSVAGATDRARLPLAGAHQSANLTLALSGAAALAKHGVGPPLEAGAVRRGIEGVSWPGRLQRCRIRGRELLVDGAHNLEAMAALAHALDSMGLSGCVHLLFSCLDDKPLGAMAALLDLPADRTTLVTGSLRLAGEVLATEGGGHA